jgi:hypothetical protein
MRPMQKGALPRWCWLSLVLTAAAAAVVVVADGSAGADSAPRPDTAATRPAAAPPTVSLNADIQKAVERAQQAVRAPQPPPAPPARNTLESQERSRQTAPVDPLPEIAQDLVGGSGLVAFRVADVIHNDRYRSGAPIAPQAVWAQARDMKYVVIAECENPTTTYFSPEARRTLEQYRELHSETGMPQTRAFAEQSKPTHLLWITTDDAAMKKWARGERRSTRATVVWAALRPGPGAYVKAELVLRTTAPATTRPAATTRGVQQD